MERLSSIRGLVVSQQKEWDRVQQDNKEVEGSSKGRIHPDSAERV